MITVRTLSSGGEPMSFEVTIQEGAGATQHCVTLDHAMWQRLGAGAHAPEDCVHAALLFLLDREPKESILRNFDVSVISDYFPEFEQEFRAYLAPRV